MSCRPFDCLILIGNVRVSSNLDVLILIGQILEYDDLSLFEGNKDILEAYVDSSVCFSRRELS